MSTKEQDFSFLGTSAKNDSNTPLAERARPQEYSDIVGQDKIWAPNRTLWKLAESDRLGAVIFSGPPGSGKTSLARVIGKNSTSPFKELSAVQHGVKEIRKEIDVSKDLIQQGLAPVMIFLDEIHRLSKNQQDVLLPALESGSIRFIGATTENPHFEVNKAILSRSLVFNLVEVNNEAVESALVKALERFGSTLTRQDACPSLIKKIAASVFGDVRRGLVLLEAALNGASESMSPVTEKSLEDLLSGAGQPYDKGGNVHFDTVSALIKSIRASHPDAALHYLARMIRGGDDPKFIARRLVVAASEDIGNANPTALLVATSGMQAVQMVGMPEGRIILSQIVTYLAASPKSDRSYLAIKEASKELDSFENFEIPTHLMNTVTRTGYGLLYSSPHEDLQKAQDLPYFPESLAGRRYYHPKEIGSEKQLKHNLERLRPQKD